MNVSFAREFFTFTNSDRALFLESSCFTIDNQSACSYKNSIYYGDQAEAYLETSRTSTNGAFCENR